MIYVVPSLKAKEKFKWRYLCENHCAIEQQHHKYAGQNGHRQPAGKLK